LTIKLALLEISKRRFHGPLVIYFFTRRLIVKELIFRICRKQKAHS